jgi:hypothetical protein
VQWPQNPKAPVNLSRLLYDREKASISWFSDPISTPRAFATRADQARQALLAGVQRDNHGQLRWAAHLVAGLGPGLTPAGDDFLLGWMAGIYLCSTAPDGRTSAHACCTHVAAVAGSKTTRLSAVWLHYAGEGAFGAPWHALAASLYTEEASQIGRALRRITATGATSGHDALAGLRWALICFGY